MLARLDAGLVRSLLAEMKKAADLVAQICQRSVISLSNGPFHARDLGAQHTLYRNTI